MGQHRTHIDFETRSLADLPKVGEHAYAQHFTTAPLMLAYLAPGLMGSLLGNDCPDVEDFMTEGDDAFTPSSWARTLWPTRPQGFARTYKYPCPPPLLSAIERDDIFVAHNARFEQAIWYWICHKIWGWPMPRRWSCTAARARYWGIRASLDGATSDLEVVNRKNPAGKEFIDNFCKPRKYKGAKKLGIIKDLWYEPHENPQGWDTGLKYCGEDVLAEKDVDDILPDLPEFEQASWDLDFKMNTRGLPIDMETVDRAKTFCDYYTQHAVQRFEAMTALRPTQRDRVLEYLQQREEIEQIGDLRSKTLKRLTLADFPLDLQDIITIRLDTSKASVKKLDSMQLCTDSDHRARGLFLWGGAHTMRWSGKRIQPQNYVRGDPKMQALVFEFLEGGWWQADRMPGIGHNGGPPPAELPGQPAWVTAAGFRFARPLGALAQSMRGFIKAPPGKKIVQGDYSQIEARKLVWFARCMEVMETFRAGRDPYVSFGAKYMYNREYEDCFEYVDGKRKVKGNFVRPRQISKSAVLGAGFGLGPPKFVEYCDNSDIIITLDEAKNAIGAWRGAHPEIAEFNTGLWARVEQAAIMAAADNRDWGNRVCLSNTGVSFHVHRIDQERYWLICTLPSGRHIAYYRPKVRLGTKWGRAAEILSFRTEWNGKSYREDTYGGKLVENIVQGAARDVMVVGALNAEAAGFPIIGLVHDELLTLPDTDFGGPEAHIELCQLMCKLPEWVTDCPIEAEGSTMIRYGK
jgi:DNA polymerase